MVRKVKTRRKDNKHVKLFLGIFVAFIMVSSIFGFILGFSGAGAPGQQRFDDYGIRFTQVVVNNQPFFEARINGMDYEFIYLPSQTTSVAPDDQTRALLQQPIHAITFEPPQEPVGVLEFVRGSLANDAARQGEQVTLGTTQASSVFNDAPAITCEDANEQQMVILLRYANQTGITAQGNCIIAEGIIPSDLLLVGEYLRYTRLGVFEG